jgi:hypothetical protein
VQRWSVFIQQALAGSDSLLGIGGVAQAGAHDNAIGDFVKVDGGFCSKGKSILAVSACARAASLLAAGREASGHASTSAAAQPPALRS